MHRETLRRAYQTLQAYRDEQEYVAVNRHAAYAQTAAGGFNSEAFFCSVAAGATAAAAEKEAVARCNSLGKRYKVKVTGTCQVYASK